MRKILTASLAVAAITAAGPSIRAAEPTALEMPEITIYHLEGRRSERIVWLMEELGLPYTLEYTRGDLAASMAAIRAVNPEMPVAPTVAIGDQIVVESGAIIETIIDRYAPGALTPARESTDYPTHLMWMHFSEGSLAARAIADYRVWQISPPERRSPLVDAHKVVQYADDFLADHEWFGGEEFTAADIMMLFPLNFAMTLNIVDASKYTNILAWRERIEARPAYQRMLEKARPDGMIGNLPKLENHGPDD